MPTFQTNDSFDGHDARLSPLQESMTSQPEVRDLAGVNQQIERDLPEADGLSEYSTQEKETIISTSSENLMRHWKRYAESFGSPDSPTLLLEKRDANFEVTDTTTGETSVDTTALTECADMMFGKDGNTPFSEKVEAVARDLVENNHESLAAIVHEFDHIGAANITDADEQKELLTQMTRDAILIAATKARSNFEAVDLIDNLAEGKINWINSDKTVPFQTETLIMAMAQLSNNKYSSTSNTTTLGIRQEFLLGAFNSNYTEADAPVYVSRLGNIAEEKLKSAFNYMKEPTTLAAFSFPTGTSITTRDIYDRFVRDGQYKDITGALSSAVHKIGDTSETNTANLHAWHVTTYAETDISERLYRGLNERLGSVENDFGIDGIKRHFNENADITSIYEAISTLEEIRNVTNATDLKDGYSAYEILNKDSLSNISPELLERIEHHLDISDPIFKEILLTDRLTHIEESITSESRTPWNTQWLEEFNSAKLAIKNGDLSKSIELLGRLAVFAENADVANKAKSTLRAAIIGDLLVGTDNPLYDVLTDPTTSLEDILTKLESLPNDDPIKERAQILLHNLKTIDNLSALAEDSEERFALMTLLRNGNSIFDGPVNLDSQTSIYEDGTSLEGLNSLERQQLNAIKTVLGIDSDEEAREILNLQTPNQILQNHGKRWTNILQRSKGKAATLALSAISTSALVLAGTPLGAGLGIAAIAGSAVYYGVKFVKLAKEKGSIKEAFKSVWSGIKTSAREAWKSVKEQKGFAALGALASATVRFGMNIVMPGSGRIAGTALEWGGRLIQNENIRGKRAELANKLMEIRTITQAQTTDSEITIEGGTNQTYTAPKGQLYIEYISKKAEIKRMLERGDINVPDVDGNPIDRDIVWGSVNDREGGEALILDLIKNNSVSTDRDRAIVVVAQELINATEKVTDIEDKYLKTISRWNAALAGAAAFGFIDNVTNLTGRAADFVRNDTPVNNSGGKKSGSNDSNDRRQGEPLNRKPEPTPKPLPGDPSVEVQAEGILVQNGSVNLPGSAWDGNMGGEPTGTLSGGIFNHSNFSGGQYHMAAFQLESDLQSLGVTRDNLLNILGTGDTNRLLSTYFSQIRSGTTNPDLPSILESMGENGKALLGTVS